MDGTWISLEKEDILRNILEKLKNKGKKVLFIIDEIINNSYVKVFASNFQIYITQNYPVYLVMAGLFDNINNLQNEKSLTFLYRAPKIFLEPLSIPAITTSYRSVFNISPSEAVEMAKLTKGYPFAFQILHISLKQHIPLLCHRPQTFIHTCHQHIRRTACLKNMQIIPNLPSIDPCPIQVNQCCLRQCRKCFMQTVYYNICSLCICILRKIRVKSKVCSVCLIHNQRNFFLMYNFRNPLNIRQHPVICR